MREPSANGRLHGFTELRVLGSGAQGRVVLARADVSGEVVAIKYLAAGLLGDAHGRATFRNEAALLARVADPHVARLRAFVEYGGGAAIVMEAVHGRSLRKLLDEENALPAEAALTILKGSLLGMAAAHSAGVVHRDYKPANVMVQDDGQSKLIDFGVAVLNGGRSVAGTPAYMAPEQWDGGPAAPATDIYAATCVFYECVTGRTPFIATTMDALREQHLTRVVPLDDLPEPLRPLVMRGMAKRPDQRFGNVREFVGTLDVIAAAAYGADWERRGLYALGATAALLTAAFPVALLGGAGASIGAGTAAGAGAAASGTAGAVASGATTGASADTGAGATTTVGGTGQAVGRPGVIGKVGGVKGLVGAGTVVTGVVIGLLLWPSGPTVGGESHGTLNAYFTQPASLLNQPYMPASETPFMKLDVTVSPARMKPGTKVTVKTHVQARTVSGAKYLPGGQRQCFGAKSKRNDVNGAYRFGLGNSVPDAKDKKAPAWFYRTSKSDAKKLPTGTGTYVVAESKAVNVSEPYVPNDCAYRSTWDDVRTFTLPDTDELKPGRYLISPAGPPRFVTVKRGKAAIPPESVGARSDGALPMVTVFWD
ncbi:serine/threonine-protein kinase [Spirillospora sp. NPDC048911]|uniref:serine/threonine-protein kinase n=1 Tax=Spirillospora sp. NPDC048911 TaxID=3364527 RepID=UPI00371FC87D